MEAGSLLLLSQLRATADTARGRFAAIPVANVACASAVCNHGCTRPCGNRTIILETQYSATLALSMRWSMRGTRWSRCGRNAGHRIGRLARAGTNWLHWVHWLGGPRAMALGIRALLEELSAAF
ncbi:hypothetical protein ANO11243_001480 [Dothideomycetidae sp. 11243]|nr:hypothetical protein ANO11243_001480 [fungal sp. No.11243]